MTIVEALRLSKHTGVAFERRGSAGYGGWIRWHPTYLYNCLSAEDLLASDWEAIEPLPDGPPIITQELGHDH